MLIGFYVLVFISSIIVYQISVKITVMQVHKTQQGA